MAGQWNVPMMYKDKEESFTFEVLKDIMLNPYFSPEAIKYVIMVAQGWYQIPAEPLTKVPPRTF